MKKWQFLQRIKFYFQRIYRISVSFKKREEIVWRDLKKMHKEAEWRSGIYENEKCIETAFAINENTFETYFYMLYYGEFHCRVKILHQIPTELTTDIFILASHFNNVLNHGSVVINVQEGYVEYHQKKNILVPLLYNGDIYAQLSEHYSTSKDVYAAFQRLILDEEAPAIIIADLLNSKKNEDREGSENK